MAVLLVCCVCHFVNFLFLLVAKEIVFVFRACWLAFVRCPPLRRFCVQEAEAKRLRDEALAAAEKAEEDRRRSEFC